GGDGGDRGPVDGDAADLPAGHAVGGGPHAPPARGARGGAVAAHWLALPLPLGACGACGAAAPASLRAFARSRSRRSFSGSSSPSAPGPAPRVAALTSALGRRLPN